MSSGRVGARAAAGIVAVVVGLVLTACEPLPPPAPGSTLIDCSRAAERVVLTASSHLDPACTYTGGFEIATSGVTLDCQGARIAGAATSGSRASSSAPPRASPCPTSPSAAARSTGFLNSVRIMRDGYRILRGGRGVPDPDLGHPPRGQPLLRVPRRRRVRRRLRRGRHPPRQRRRPAPAARASTSRPAPGGTGSRASSSSTAATSRTDRAGSSAPSTAPRCGSGASGARASPSTAPTRT